MMRSRALVTCIVWLFAGAFAVPHVPSVLAQARSAALETAVGEERRLHTRKMVEFATRRIDARAQWEIEHLDCRAVDACEKRAVKKYEDRRREIANAETKARAAHENRIAGLRAGTVSPPRGPVSSSPSRAEIELAVTNEEERHRATLVELEQRMTDAHAQWQIDHRNCGANDACDKRALQQYDDRRLEIAKQKVKERAAHEKKLAGLRAGVLSSPRHAGGDVFSSTSGDDRRTPGDPSGGRGAGPDVSSIPTAPGRSPLPGGSPQGGGAPETLGGGGPSPAPGGRDESSSTHHELPQVWGMRPSGSDREYTIAGAYPSGRVTLKLSWNEQVTTSIHRAGRCSFVVEYLSTGVAKVYEFEYHNEDTSWPYPDQKQVEITHVERKFPEGQAFGPPGNGLRINSVRGQDGRSRFTADFITPTYPTLTTIHRYTYWDGHQVAHDERQGPLLGDAICMHKIGHVDGLNGELPAPGKSPEVPALQTGLLKQVSTVKLHVTWKLVPAASREGAR